MSELRARSTPNYVPARTQPAYMARVDTGREDVRRRTESDRPAAGF